MGPWVSLDSRSDCMVRLYKKCGGGACITRGGALNRSNMIDNRVSFLIAFLRKNCMAYIFFNPSSHTVATACEMTAIILERESVDNSERRVCV